MLKKIFTFIFMLLPLTKAYGELTANIGIASNYYANGASQTQNKPAVNGGFDYAHKNGFYINNWNSTVSKVMFLKGYGFESDLYLGYKKEFTYFTAKGGAYAYLYPGAKTPTGRTYNTKGLYYAMIFGPLKLQVGQSIGNYTGAPRTDRTRYYEAELNVPLHSKVKINVHMGYLDSPLGRSNSCYDAQIGPIFNIFNGELKVQYNNNRLKTNLRQDNILKGEKLYKNTVVVSYQYTHTF